VLSLSAILLAEIPQERSLHRYAAFRFATGLQSHSSVGVIYFGRFIDKQRTAHRNVQEKTEQRGHACPQSHKNIHNELQLKIFVLLLAYIFSELMTQKFRFQFIH
jgi:hypothetical protein